MSDFDKEAEREKLREQFAEDERKRRNTQRMSELLLKGATMTDTHCDTCGDPIFRWDGQEFCPTCSAEGEGAQQAQQTQQAQQANQQPVDQAQQADGEDVAGADSPEPEPEPQAPPEPNLSPGTDTGTGTEADAEDQPEVTTEPETAGPGADGEVTADATEPAPGGEPTRTADRSSRSARGRTATDGRTASGPATEGDLGAAQGSLVRTLTRFASEAEETANPAEARERLAAVEAAADALAALRRAER